MSSSTVGKHTGSSTMSNQPAVAEPTFAERARTLVYLGRLGSLSTLSRKQHGFPFGSVMPYGLDDRANPVFLISTMAMHTQNIQADPRSSLLVTQPDTAGDPLGASRVTLLGNILPVPVPVGQRRCPFQGIVEDSSSDTPTLQKRPKRSTHSASPLFRRDRERDD